MPRFAFVVVPLPDDAPTDPQAIANSLHVAFCPPDVEDAVTLDFTSYTSLATVVRDRLAGCATNGYWAGDLEVSPAPLAVALA